MAKKKKAPKKNSRVAERWDTEDAVVEKIEEVSKKVGRPSKFNQALADDICTGIMEGTPLREIASNCGIHVTVIFQWLQKRPGFFDQYARAREVQAELMADELKSIADETPEITTVTTSPSGSTSERTALDSAGVYRNRLRVDTRKWIAAKLLPKKYGEHLKVEASGPNGVPLPGVTMNIRALSDDQLEQLAQITTKLGSDPGGAAETAQG